MFTLINGLHDDRVYLSLPAGMQAFYEVNSCDSKAGPTAMDGVVRDYYLAVEKVLWNYAPSEKDLINNASLTEAHRWASLHTAASRLINCNLEGNCKTV